MSKFFRLLLGIIILLNCAFLSAFSQEKDAELWTTVKLKKRVTKRLDFVLEPSLRLNNNYQNIKKICFDAGAVYELNSYMNVEGFYRYSLAEPTFGYANYHRFYTNLEFNYRISNLRLTLRTRWQTEYQSYYSDSEGQVPIHYSRNKIALKYYIPKKPLSLVLSYEMFSRILSEDKFNTDCNRYKISLEYDYKKRREFEVFYAYQPEQNTSSFVITHIVGINYSIGFKKFKKKKSKE